MKSLYNVIKSSQQSPSAKKHIASNTQLNIKPKSNLSQENKTAGLSIQQQEKIADDIIAKAQQQAKKIVDQAQNYSLYYMKTTAGRIDSQTEMAANRSHEIGLEKGMQEGQKKGYEIGFEAGYQEGLLKAEEESQKVVAFMHGVIEGIDEGKQGLIKKYEEDIHELAFAIAKTIVKKELEVHPETLQNIIENAALMCKNQGAMRINVSPNSYNLLAGNKSTLERKLSGISEDVKFISDSSLKDTDCYIETPIGFIDASVDTQLNNIELALNHEAKRK